MRGGGATEPPARPADLPPRRLDRAARRGLRAVGRRRPARRSTTRSRWRRSTRSAASTPSRRRGARRRRRRGGGTPIAGFHASAPRRPRAAKRCAPQLEPLGENLATLRESAPGSSTRPAAEAAELQSTPSSSPHLAELERRRRRRADPRRSRRPARRARDLPRRRARHLRLHRVRPAPARDRRRPPTSPSWSWTWSGSAAGLALALVTAYRRAGGDPGDDELLAFFAAYRAWVRATVACERAAELADDPAARAGQEEQARALVELGHRFAWRARGRSCCRLRGGRERQDDRGRAPGGDRRPAPSPPT